MERDEHADGKATFEGSQLCRFCKEVKFAAILTPRAWDEEAKRWTAIYRPEWSGTGLSPSLEWTHFGKTKRLGSPESHLPQIRTAHYDELSDSGESELGDILPWKATELNTATSKTNLEAEILPGDHPLAVHSSFAEDLSAEDLSAVDLGDLEDIDTGDEWSDDDNDDSGEESEVSASTWSNRSHFTEIQRIDPEKQARGDWHYYPGHLYYFGSIWDVRSRRYECELCWKMWDSMRKNPDVKNKFLTKSRCILKLVGLKGRKNDGSNSEVIMLNLAFIYGYKLGNPREDDWVIGIEFVLHGTHRDICDLRDRTPADHVLSFDDRLFGEARWRKRECDYELLQAWLRTCETKHVHNVPRFNDELKIRLIDVQQKCLVEWNGPTEEVPRFLALSYVWGRSAQKVMLTTEKLGRFMQPGALDQPLDETVANSIEVVSKLGEKYLWIDALCILQDNQEDKSVQVPQMHKIYGKAIVTLVAGYGNNADAGLPGVEGRKGVKGRTGNRFKLEVDDIRISLRSQSRFYGPHLAIGFNENYLESRVYQQRAWTFQEGHLSNRVLIFTKDQVYWECDRCTWCEDAHWESETYDFISLRAIKNRTPEDVWKDRFDRNAYDIVGRDAKPDPPSRSYAALIKEYSMRELTYDGDILDACMGVLSSIKERESSEFLLGLRTRNFGNDLLFNILRAVPARFPGRDPVPRRFPTWSWASWKGTIEIANEPRNNSFDLVENLIPCDGVKCFVLVVDHHGQRSLQEINETGGWRFQRNYVRRGEGIYNLAEPTGPRRTKDLTDSDSDTCEVGSVDGTMEVTGKTKTEATAPATELPLKDMIIKDRLSPQDTFDDDIDIPVYPQDLSLADLESHPAYSRLAPKFHIIFRTFASTVVVRTEWDEMAIMMSNIIMAGTKITRGGSMWENRDPIQRNVYVCKAEPSDSSSIADRAAQGAQSEHSHSGNHRKEEPSSCPCCGNDTAPGALPSGLELGPYIGRLPRLKTSWDSRAYIEAVPDGVYRLLWMNNNQLPMFGHLLCKPMSESASRDGNWDGEILQRVCGVVGPTEILSKEQQERYGATWKTIILG